MSTLEIAKRYVALCRDGKYEECLDELFAGGAESVEPFGSPGHERVTSGRDAIRKKLHAWVAGFEVHSATIGDAYPHGDRFAVRFVYDMTNKATRERTTLDEIGLFTVRDGKIEREEFFYGG